MALDVAATFRRLTAFCYLAAFVSLLAQWRGLYANGSGMEPIMSFLIQAVGDGSGAGKTVDAGATGAAGAALPTAMRLRVHEPASQWWNVPTLTLFAGWCGVSPDIVFEACLLLGVLFAASASLVPARRHLSWQLAMLWLLYLSTFTVGGTFLSFQWDLLLLECGWLAIWIHTGPGRWLARFAAFKLMLMSGAVKLTAQCPTWAGLTATEVHFASQCIPNAAAWYAHNAPPVFHRLSVAITMWTELPGALLLLAPPPLTLWAQAGAVLQVLLQLMIIATGNYNFFNLLTIALVMTAWPHRDSADSSQDVHKASSGSPNTEGWLSTSPTTDSSDEEIVSTEVTLREHGPMAYMQHAMTALEQHWLVRWAQLISLFIFTATTWVYMFDLRTHAGSNRGAGSRSSGGAQPWWWAGPEALQPLLARLRLGDIIMSKALAGAEFGRFLDFWLPRTIAVCAAGLALLVLLYLQSAVWRVVRDVIGGHGSPDTVGNVGVPRLLTQLWWFVQLLVRLVLACVRLCWIAVTVYAVYATYASSAVALASLRSHLLQQGGGRGAITIPRHFVATAQQYHNLHIAHGYGLFRRMTGVKEDGARVDAFALPVTGTARPEVILEGLWRVPAQHNRTASSLGAPLLEFAPSDVTQLIEHTDATTGETAQWVWAALELPFKPGDPSRVPPFIVPHQARLDWQMWFAALGTYQGAPWLVHFVDLLLSGVPDAYAQLDQDVYPVKRHLPVLRDGVDEEAAGPEGATPTAAMGFLGWRTYLVPPTYIRASLYHYDFTRASTPWARARHTDLDASAFPCERNGTTSVDGSCGPQRVTWQGPHLARGIRRVSVASNAKADHGKTADVQDVPPWVVAASTGKLEGGLTSEATVPASKMPAVFRRWEREAAVEPLAVCSRWLTAAAAARVTINTSDVSALPSGLCARHGGAQQMASLLRSVTTALTLTSAEAVPWWQRQYMQEYLPPLHGAEESVHTFLSHFGWSHEGTVALLEAQRPPCDKLGRYGCGAFVLRAGSATSTETASIDSMGAVRRGDGLSKAAPVTHELLIAVAPQIGPAAAVSDLVAADGRPIPRCELTAIRAAARRYVKKYASTLLRHVNSSIGLDGSVGRTAAAAAATAWSASMGVGPDGETTQDPCIRRSAVQPVDSTY